MVASLLTAADILVAPRNAGRLPNLQKRDFSLPYSGKRFLQATGAEIVEKGIDEKTMSFAAIISTDEVDRVGDILVPEGCDFRAYSQNALVFLNHQSEHIPIGTCWDENGKFYFAVDPHQVLARCFCVQGGEFGQDAADIFHLIVQRAFNDVSVGFNPDPDPRNTQRLDTGGNRYVKWEILEWGPVGIGCNRGAKIIRKYLTDGKITGKSISPQLVKLLAPFAEPAPVQVTGGFAAPSPSSPQSQPSSRSTRMSKKWGKYKAKAKRDQRMNNTETVEKREFSQAQRDRAADSGAALPDGSFPIHNKEDLENALKAVGRAKDQEKVRRHISKRARELGLQHLLPDDWNDRAGGSGAKPKKDDKSETPATEKALAESGGTSGGYAVGAGSGMDHSRIKGEIAGVMAANGADGHEAHYQAETGLVHHQHPEGADEEQLKAIHQGLAGIKGVQTVTQSKEPPIEGEAYEKVFPAGQAPDHFVHVDVNMPGSTDMGSSGKQEEDYKRKFQLAYHLGRGKVLALLVKLMTTKDAEELTACTRQRAEAIKLEHPEIDAGQREAVALSLCGEKFLSGEEKDWGIAKSFDVAKLKFNPQTPDAGGDGDPIPEEESSTAVPPSLKLCQQVSEIIEGALPGLEPETADFWEDILDFVQDHGAERYPDMFPGDDDDDDEEDGAADVADADDADFAEEVSAAYRQKPSKRLQIMQRKSMQALRKGDHLQVIKAAADHMHDLAGKALGYTFGKEDKAMMKDHARNLDRVHGAATAYARPGSVSDGDDADAEAEQPVAKSVDLSHGDIDNLIVTTTAEVLEKSFAGDTVTVSPNVERLDHLRESLTNIFGTRF